MLTFKYLPEIAVVLIYMMMATQRPALGPIFILCEFALVGMLVLLRPKVFLDIVLRWWPLLLLPLLAIVSALWSELPAASARYGLQYLFTALVGVLFARLMSPRRYITVLMVALCPFLILCILDGTEGSSAQGAVLIGLTGSKNQIAYSGQMLLMCAVATLTFRDISALTRWLAILSLPLSLYILLETNSATAVLMGVGGVALLLGLWFAERMQPGGRLAAALAIVVVLAPLTALLPEAQQWFDHFLFDTLDKDPTLSGRVELWATADELIARRPLLGYGYEAIWRSESDEAIGLLRMTGKAPGTFHFHDQFRQTGVDNGWVGMITLVGTLVAVGLAGLRQVLLFPRVETSLFFIMFAMTVARAFTDVITGQFSIFTVFFFSACAYAFWPAQANAPVPAPAPAPMRAPLARAARR